MSKEMMRRMNEERKKRNEHKRTLRWSRIARLIKYLTFIMLNMSAKDAWGYGLTNYSVC